MTKKRDVQRGTYNNRCCPIVELTKTSSNKKNPYINDELLCVNFVLTYRITVYLMHSG